MSHQGFGLIRPELAFLLQIAFWGTLRLPALPRHRARRPQQYLCPCFRGCSLAAEDASATTPRCVPIQLVVVDANKHVLGNSR